MVCIFFEELPMEGTINCTTIQYISRKSTKTLTNNVLIVFNIRSRYLSPKNAIGIRNIRRRRGRMRSSRSVSEKIKAKRMTIREITARAQCMYFSNKVRKRLCTKNKSVISLVGVTNIIK